MGIMDNLPTFTEVSEGTTLFDAVREGFLHGVHDDETGTVDGYGLHTVRVGNAIMQTNEQGFVWVWLFLFEAEALDEYERQAAAYAGWLEREEEEV